MTPEALMRRLAKAIASSDFQSLLAAMDENVVWRAGAGAAGPVELAGRYSSRAEVLAITSKLATRLSFYRFEPREIVTQGDVVWGWFDAAASLLQRGSQILQFEVVLRWRVRADKVLEHQAFYDTAYVAAQLRGARGAKDPVGP